MEKTDREQLNQRIYELTSQLDVMKDEREQLLTTWGMALEALKIEISRWTSAFSKKELLDRLHEEDFKGDAFKLPWTLDTEKYNSIILNQEVKFRAYAEAR